MIIKNRQFISKETCYSIVNLRKRGIRVMAKYIVELSEEDIQMIKDCHSKNPSIMKAMENAKKEN